MKRFGHVVTATVLLMTCSASPSFGEGPSKSGSANNDEAAWAELDAQAVALYQQGRYPEATVLTEDALRRAVEVFGPDHMNVAKYQHNLAQLYARQHKESEAALLSQRSFEIIQRTQEASSPQTATALDRRMGSPPHADAREAQGTSARAAEASQRALWTQLSAQVSTLSQQGRYPEATEAAKKAVQMAEAIFEPDDPRLSVSLSDLAEMYRVTNQPAKAEPLHKRALAIRQKAFGPRHPAVAESLSALGRLYAGQRNYAKAQSLYEQALAIDEATFGKDHFTVANDVLLLAELQAAKGDDAAAVPFYKRVLTILENPASGSNPRDIVETLGKCAAALRKSGNANEAAAMEARAKALLTASQSNR